MFDDFSSIQQLPRQSSLESLDHGPHQSLEPGEEQLGSLVLLLSLQCGWLIIPALPSDWLLSLTFSSKSASVKLSPCVPRTGEKTVRDAGLEEPRAQVIIVTILTLVLLLGNLSDIEPGGFYRNLYLKFNNERIKWPGKGCAFVASSPCLPKAQCPL